MSNPNNRPIAQPRSKLHPRHAKDTTRANATAAGDVHSGDEEELPYEERQLRNQAARVLANEELLVWLSRERNESLLQTRIYCEARAAGLCEEDLRFDYTLDLSEERGPQSPAAKGTARVVSGSSKHAAGSPANGRKDKDRERGRRSNGAAR